MASYLENLLNLGLEWNPRIKGRTMGNYIDDELRMISRVANPKERKQILGILFASAGTLRVVNKERFLAAAGTLKEAERYPAKIIESIELEYIAFKEEMSVSYINPSLYRYLENEDDEVKGLYGSLDSTFAMKRLFNIEEAQKQMRDKFHEAFAKVLLEIKTIKMEEELWEQVVMPIIENGE